MSVLTTDSQEDRARLLNAVAREIADVCPDGAREAAELLVIQLTEEGTPLDEENVRAHARKRYFLTLDDSWRALFVSGDARDLAELVRRELRPRIAPDDSYLQVKLLLRCKERSSELTVRMRSALEIHGPEHAKREACLAIWRDIVSLHFQSASRALESRPFDRLNHEFELRANDLLQVMTFVELVDLARPERTQAVIDAAPPIPSQVGGVRYIDEMALDRPRPRGAGPVKTRSRKPRQQRPALTETELHRLAEAAKALEQAMPAARERLAGSKWGEVLNQMAADEPNEITEADRSRAYHRLGKALNQDGFACGKEIAEPEGFLGARHVFPPGCTLQATPDPETREGRAFAAELDRKQLKAIAAAAGYRWPSPGSPESAWAEVTACLSGLRKSRCTARGDATAIHERDPFSRLPAGLPSRFAKPRSAARQEQLEDLDARLFEYGRVIVLPPSALPIEALSRRANRYDEVLAPPLNKVHVGEWYFFPQKGIDDD